jgi:predicted kinase
MFLRKDVLQRRIVQRGAQANDASEADVDVLEWQLAGEKPPATSEPVVRIDGEQANPQQIVDALVARCIASKEFCRTSAVRSRTPLPGAF